MNKMLRKVITDESPVQPADESPSNMTAREFAPLFRAVADHFGIHGAERETVWRLCLEPQMRYTIENVAPCYSAVARSLP